MRHRSLPSLVYFCTRSLRQFSFGEKSQLSCVFHFKKQNIMIFYIRGTIWLAPNCTCNVAWRQQTLQSFPSKKEFIIFQFSLRDKQHLELLHIQEHRTLGQVELGARDCCFLLGNQDHTQLVLGSLLCISSCCCCNQQTVKYSGSLCRTSLHKL